MRPHESPDIRFDRVRGGEGGERSSAITVNLNNNRVKLTRHLKHYFVLPPFWCRSASALISLWVDTISVLLLLLLLIFTSFREHTVVVTLFRNIHNLLNKLWHVVSLIFVEEQRSLKARVCWYFPLYFFSSWHNDFTCVYTEYTEYCLIEIRRISNFRFLLIFPLYL